MVDMLEGDDDLLRRYLLGELSQEEEDHLEQRLLQENRLFRRAELVEGDLLAEYARGGLTPAQRDRIQLWSASVRGRARLALSQGLTQIYDEQVEEQPTVPTVIPLQVLPFKKRVPAKPPTWHRWVAALAAALLLFVVTPLAVRTALDKAAEAPAAAQKMPKSPPVVFSSEAPEPAATPEIGTPDPGPPLSESPSRQAQASPPASPQEEAVVAVVSLAFVGANRGENEPPATVYDVRKGAQEVQFEVPTDGQTDDSYRVSLNNKDIGQEVALEEGLKPVSLSSGQGLRFKVPAGDVPEGHYHIEVRGVTADGVNPIPFMDQDFEIRKK